MARGHVVELLVLAAAASELVVVLDQLVTGVLGRVGVDPEGADVEAPADRPPDERPVDRDGVELREMSGVERLRVHARKVFHTATVPRSCAAISERTGSAGSSARA